MIFSIVMVLRNSSLSLSASTFASCRLHCSRLCAGSERESERTREQESGRERERVRARESKGCLHGRSGSALGDLPRTERQAAWIGVLDEQDEGLKDVVRDENKEECDVWWKVEEPRDSRETRVERYEQTSTRPGIPP